MFGMATGLPGARALSNGIEQTSGLAEVIVSLRGFGRAIAVRGGRHVPMKGGSPAGGGLATSWPKAIPQAIVKRINDDRIGPLTPCCRNCTSISER
jgi:hypothetical protein